MRWCDTGDMVILSNGKIAVVGRCEMLDDRHLSSVAMFNEDGSVDQTFGDEGFAYVEAWPDSGAGPTGWEWFTCIIEQDDGKLLAAGQRGGYLDNGEFEYSYLLTLARFNSDGTKDGNFGVNGVVFRRKSVSSTNSRLLLCKKIRKLLHSDSKMRATIMPTTFSLSVTTSTAHPT